MIFTLIVSVLNAAGWIGVYLGIGGYTEDPNLIFTSIATMIIASVVGGVVGFFGRSLSSNLFSNILFMVLSTSILSFPFANLLYDVVLFNKIFSFFVCGFIFLLIMSIIGFLPNDYECEGRIVSFLGKFIAVTVLLFCGAAVFSGNILGLDLLGHCIVTSLPLSIVLGIKNTFCD